MAAWAERLVSQATGSRVQALEPVLAAVGAASLTCDCSLPTGGSFIAGGTATGGDGGCEVELDKTLSPLSGYKLASGLKTLRGGRHLASAYLYDGRSPRGWQHSSRYLFGVLYRSSYTEPSY